MWETLWFQTVVFVGASSCVAATSRGNRRRRSSAEPREWDLMAWDIERHLSLEVCVPGLPLIIQDPLRVSSRLMAIVLRVSFSGEKLGCPTLHEELKCYAPGAASGFPSLGDPGFSNMFQMWNMLKPLAKISIATMDQSTLQPPVASLMPIVIQWRLGAKRPQSSRRLVGVRDFKFLVCLVQEWASLAGRDLR